MVWNSTFAGNAYDNVYLDQYIDWAAIETMNRARNSFTTR